MAKVAMEGGRQAVYSSETARVALPQTSQKRAFSADVEQRDFEVPELHREHREWHGGENGIWDNFSESVPRAVQGMALPVFAG